MGYCMRKSGMTEKHVRVVHDMYEDSETVVRCKVEVTDRLKVGLVFIKAESLERWRHAVEYGAVSQEEKKNTTEKTLRCSKGKHADSLHDRSGCK